MARMPRYHQVLNFAAVVLALWALFLFAGLFFLAAVVPFLFALGIVVIGLTTWGALLFAFIAATVLTRMLGTAE